MCNPKGQKAPYLPAEKGGGRGKERDIREDWVGRERETQWEERGEGRERGKREGKRKGELSSLGFLEQNL